MTECHACGSRVSPGEHFCGNCGMQLMSSSAPEMETLSATLGDEPEVHSPNSSAFAETLEPEPEPETTDEAPITAEQPVYQDAAAAAPAVAEEAPRSDNLKTNVVEHADEDRPISSVSLGGSYTDDVRAPSGTAAHKGTTGGHRPAVKQLASNTVLNGRYEIVRRIGGGGMGAVYLAKDRNLGDAPRAVKEMVE